MGERKGGVSEALRWLLGFLTAALWASINFFLTIKLLKVATLKESKKKLYLILAVKFPALYLIGFLILVSKFFPPLSLLAGLVTILAVTGVAGLWPKRT